MKRVEKKDQNKKKEDKYILKKFDVQVKKVDRGTHSNIHQKSNVTAMKFIIDKEDDAERRRNKKEYYQCEEICDPMEEREKQ